MAELVEPNHEPVYYRLRSAAIEAVIAHCYSKYNGRQHSATECAMEALRILEEEGIIGGNAADNFEMNKYFLPYQDAFVLEINDVTTEKEGE